MSGGQIFRARAIAQAAQAETRADVLRISPAWTRPAYWVIVGGVAVGLAYLALAQVSEWAQGPAIVHVAGTTELTAKAPGTVARVLVEPGDRVAEGQLLGTLNDDSERAQLKRLEEEFKLQLVRTLRDPADQAARQSLLTLRVERDLARSRLLDLSLRAPRAGSVEDIRVREGQPVAPGDHLLTLAGEESACAVWALLPGRYRPELHGGAQFRFNVVGYRYAQAKTQLSDVGTQVIGPREVRRYLGSEIGDALEIAGPVVIAKAELDGCTFESDGERFRFHEGMSGTGEVELRAEPLWEVLFPDLRKIFRWLHD